MIALKDIRDWLPGNEWGTQDDAFLLAAEARVVDILSDLTGRYLGASASVVELIDGSGTAELWLDDEPDGTEAFLLEEKFSDLGWTTVDSARYTRDGRRLMLWAPESCWSRGAGRYRATYTRGTDAGSEPGRDRQAVLEALRFVLQEGRIKSVKDLQGTTGTLGIESVPAVQTLMRLTHRSLW